MPSVASTSFFLKPACLARPNQRGRRCIGPETKRESVLGPASQRPNAMPVGTRRLAALAGRRTLHMLAHRRAQRGAENTPRAFLISARARAEYAVQLHAEYDGLLVFRVPAAHAIATAALRGVQRLVRANLERLREIVRGARELGVQCGDADADRDVDSARLAEVVLTNAFAQPHRELIRARWRRVRKQQRELLAARARDDVAGARGVQQERTELTEHRVTHDVPPGVVHALEVVDVDGEQRELAPHARGARQLTSQRLIEPAPVDARGERIGEHHARQLGPDTVVRAARAGDRVWTSIRILVVGLDRKST